MGSNLLDHLGKNYFTGLPRLSTLYIENNKLTAVHSEAFSGLEGKLIQKILTYTYLRDYKNQIIDRSEMKEKMYIKKFY